MATINYEPLLTKQEYEDALVAFISGQEGERAHVYKDDDGKATIGYGYRKRGVRPYNFHVKCKA